MQSLVPELSSAVQCADNLKTQLFMLMTATGNKDPHFTEHYYRRFVDAHEDYVKASQNFIKQVNRLAINKAVTSIDKEFGR